MADQGKIDLIIQYALLVAGEQDNPFDRQLGPIHLIKYVYLADLYYARKNHGSTFTGVNWQFYKFGPWSQVVNARLEPALLALSANRMTFESEYGKDDWIRWSIHSEYKLGEISSQVPGSIKLWLDRDIKKFLKDTSGLLDHVYKTAPMLAAAPEEYLDFSLVKIEVDGQEGEQDLVQKRWDSLSKKRQNKFKEGMLGLKDEFRKRHQAKPKLVVPPAPRYDEIFENGVVWLEQLESDPLQEKTVTVTFSPSVWKSSARKGEDVS